MALTPEQVRAWREELEIWKQRQFSRGRFASDVKEELEAIEKDLIGYDPDFAVEILRQLAEALVRHDGNGAMRLRCARSIIRTVTSGNPLEIMWIVQMICIYHAAMNHSAFLGSSKDPLQSESYANTLNKLVRTYTDQMVKLHQIRSGPQPSLQYNVSVNDGGQAIVGTVNQNGAEKDKSDGTKAPPLVADQSGTAMPMVQQDNQSAATVPRMGQDQQPAPSTTRRKRRELQALTSATLYPCFRVHVAVRGPAQVDPVGRPQLVERGVVACTVVRRGPAHHSKIRTRLSTGTLHARKGLSAGASLNSCGNRGN